MVEFLVRWSPQRTLVPSFFFLLLSAVFVLGLFMYDFMWFIKLRAWAGMFGECASVSGCVQVCNCSQACVGVFRCICGCMRVCMGVFLCLCRCAQVVCGCTRVYTGLRGCTWVYVGVHGCTLVWVGVRRCVHRCARVRVRVWD